MHIRLAQLPDAPEIIRLGKELLNLHTEYDFDYYHLEDNFDELFTVWVKDQLNHPYQFIYVAQNPSDNKIVGFISGFVKYLYPWFKTKSVGHISYMIIDTNFRRKGVGKLLEDAALGWFKTKNISYVELYVEEKNQPGKNAWDKYGFLPFKKFLRKKIPLQG